MPIAPPPTPLPPCCRSTATATTATRPPSLARTRQKKTGSSYTSRAPSHPRARAQPPRSAVLRQLGREQRARKSGGTRETGAASAPPKGKATSEAQMPSFVRRQWRRLALYRILLSVRNLCLFRVGGERGGGGGGGGERVSKATRGGGDERRAVGGGAAAAAGALLPALAAARAGAARCGHGDRATTIAARRSRPPAQP
jgi:hypothetical protein